MLKVFTHWQQSEVMLKVFTQITVQVMLKVFTHWQQSEGDAKGLHTLATKSV